MTTAPDTPRITNETPTRTFRAPDTLWNQARTRAASLEPKGQLAKLPDLTDAETAALLDALNLDEFGALVDETIARYSDE